VSSDLCQVSAMLAYLLVRGRQDGPLFRFQDGKPLTRPRFVSTMWNVLVTAGIQTAAAMGMETLSSVLWDIGRVWLT